MYKLIGSLLFGLFSVAMAQSAPESYINIAFTYSANHANLVPGANFWLQGGSVQLDAGAIKGFGIAADITGLHAGQISSSGVALDTVTATFGPRYRWNIPSRAKTRDLTLFGHALVGEVNGFHSVFPSVTGAQSNASALALRIGGGLDIGISRHLAIRAVHADWLHTQLPNGTSNRQNSLELGTGFVIRFY